MSSVTGNPEPDSVKMDRIIAQLTTMNNRLNAHDQRIVRTEKFHSGDEEDHEPQGSPDRRRHGGTEEGIFSGGRGNGPRRHDRIGPREPNLNFPHYDDELDPLPWLNKCEGYFRGYLTLLEDKVWMVRRRNGTTSCSVISASSLSRALSNAPTCASARPSAPTHLGS
jgi:hypothetical protein